MVEEMEDATPKRRDRGKAQESAVHATILTIPPDAIISNKEMEGDAWTASASPAPNAATDRKHRTKNDMVFRMISQHTSFFASSQDGNYSISRVDRAAFRTWFRVKFLDKKEAP
jgi:hypothetical protein